MKDSLGPKCKGCNQNHRCNLYYRYTYEGTTYQCPCQNCLVKGICRKDCDEYATFYHTFFKRLNEHNPHIIKEP